jgi:GDP-D-mannose dehydratase
VYRSEDYLFGKVVSSIIEKKKITVGSLEMHRDILHASWVSERSLLAQSSQVIGSGTVRSVRSYIHDVYSLCGLDASQYVEETSAKNHHSNTIYLMSDKIMYEYENLLKDTVNDIQGSISKRHNH